MSGGPDPLGRRPGSAKAFFSGTHRVRHPEHTWEIMAPKLPRFGITRIADVTGLDTLGVPVAMSVRPLAKTLSVSQGKGQTYQLAKISAAMEAIELWHTEHVRPPPSHRGTPSRDLPLPYSIESLTDPGSLVGDATPLDWVDATGLRSGSRVPVPVNPVLYTQTPDQPWAPVGFAWSSNGLASGNSWHEACLHGLYEVVERDAASAGGPSAARPVDPLSVDDEGCAQLIELIHAAGARLDVHFLPSRFGVPCFGAGVWSPEFPVAGLGWGAHSDRGVALSRAVTEAAQSRLTAIAGSRDDLPSIYDQVRGGTHARPEEPRVLYSWPDVAKESAHDFTDLADELAWLCARVARVIGCEPLAVDLSTEDDFAVAKVIVPGAELDMDIVHPEH